MNGRSPIDPSLLTPSLGTESQPQQVLPIYSPTALALTAFFGGPFALLAIAGLNVERLNRMSVDGTLLLAGVALSVGFLALVYGPAAGTFLPDMAPETVRVLVRAFSLALFAAAYSRHRRFYRAMQFVGLSGPRAIGIALVCIVVGAMVLQFTIRLLRA